MDLINLTLRPESRISFYGDKEVQVKVQTPNQTVRIIQSAAPVGPGSGSAGYIHTQSTDAAQWIVNHNLGYKPVISVQSVGGVEVDAQIVHTSVNQVVIDFQIPYKGFAIAR